MYQEYNEYIYMWVTTISHYIGILLNLFHRWWNFCHRTYWIARNELYFIQSIHQCYQAGYTVTYAITSFLHIGHNRLIWPHSSHKQKCRHGKAKRRLSSVIHHAHLLETIRKHEKNIFIFQMLPCCIDGSGSTSFNCWI